jgi:hypothetical protein
MIPLTTRLFSHWSIPLNTLNSLINFCERRGKKLYCRKIHINTNPYASSHRGGNFLRLYYSSYRVSLILVCSHSFSLITITSHYSHSFSSLPTFYNLFPPCLIFPILSHYSHSFSFIPTLSHLSPPPSLSLLRLFLIYSPF